MPEVAPRIITHASVVRRSQPAAARSHAMAAQTATSYPLSRWDPPSKPISTGVSVPKQPKLPE
eukprot:247575-Lingulodinium_polyedra.AAC.1